MINPNFITTIPTDLKRFFELWLNFISPFIKLSELEIKVLSFFLYKNYQLKGNKDIDMLLFSTGYRKQCAEELKISAGTLNQCMFKIRHKGIIDDKSIDSKYIPRLDKEMKNFIFAINFKIVDNE